MTTRLKDLGSVVRGGVAVSDSFLIASGESGSEKKITLDTLLETLGVRVFAFADIPSGYSGGMIFVSNGRKVGEGSGLGSGVVCTWNGSNWITTDAGTTVAA